MGKDIVRRSGTPWKASQWFVFVKFGIDRREQLERFKQVAKEAPQFKREVSNLMKGLSEKV